MKVAFWSNVRGQGGSTTNMAIMSILRAIEGGSKTILLENHFNINNLETILMRPYNDWGLVRENNPYFYNIGLEYLMKNIYNVKSKNLLVKRSSIPILDSNILYLPQSNIVNREVFSFEFSHVMYHLFLCLENVIDTVFIDTEINDNLSSRLILDEADVVVVNLSQNPNVLDNFFCNYSAVKNKSIYLIGNYRMDSKYNVNEIIKEYCIPEDRIGVIPYHTELADAITEGRLIGFLSRNLQCRENENNFGFIKQIRDTSIILENNLRNLDWITI